MNKCSNKRYLYGGTRGLHHRLKKKASKKKKSFELYRERKALREQSRKQLISAGFLVLVAFAHGIDASQSFFSKKSDFNQVNQE